VALLLVSKSHAATNLVANGGLEETSDKKLPPHWEPFVVSVPGTFTIDESVKHEGRQSVRIDAPENTRLYLRSEPIPVAPGEKITASAWVKCKDVPVGKGTVILIAEFTNSQDSSSTVEKFGVADRKAGTDIDWQKIEGTVTVPPLMTNLRLRMGFSYSQGTIWWDDVTVTAENPIVAVIQMSQPRLSPASSEIPVNVLNRTGLRERMMLEVTLGKQKNTLNVDLNGDSQQHFDVPIPIQQRGPKQTLVASLLKHGEAEPLFSDKRTVVVPAPLTMQPLSPTHWCIEDGHATIDGTLDVAMTPQEMEAASVKLAVIDADGKTVLERARDKELVDGHNAFQLVLPDLPLGSFTVSATIEPKTGEKFHAEQPWQIIPRKLAKVTLNSDGFCVYNGKPIFGVGIYNGGARTKEMGEAGFTVNHAYNAMNVELGEPPNDIGAKQFMDSSEAAGMKVMFLIPRGLVFHGDWDGFRRRVRMFRNHPALLCWDEEEGLARGDMKMDSLVKMVQIIREEDPNHPIMVGDMKDVGTRLPDRRDIFPVDQMDMGQWWWYPLPLKEQLDTGLEIQGAKMGSGSELVPPPFLAQRTTNKPIWVGIQGYKKGDDSRYPTPAEYRAQAYLAVICGAKGVMWYGGSVTGGIFLKPEEGHWDDLKKLATELHEMIPVFLSPTIDAPTIEPKNALVSVTMKHAEGRDVLLACNRSTNAADVTFASPQIRAGEVSVLNEDRKVRADKGSLRDHFEPLAVHLYELRH
jgi:hypothetical protein